MSRRPLAATLTILGMLAFNCQEGDRRCTAGSCPGWYVFNGCEIQVCDTCNHARPDALKLSDNDVAALPEARELLRITLSGEA